MSKEVKYLGVEGLSKYFAVSNSTIRNWVRSGMIPKHAYLCIGNVYRYNVAAVEVALICFGKEGFGPADIPESVAVVEEEITEDDLVEVEGVELEQVDTFIPDELYEEEDI